MKWLDRLLISLNLRKTQPLRAAAIEPEPEAMAGPDWKDGDTLPFVHREAVSIPLSQIPVIPKPATAPRAEVVRLQPVRYRADMSVFSPRRDNPMGDPWVPPGAGGYGAAASQVESGEAPAPAPEQPEAERKENP